MNNELLSQITKSSHEITPEDVVGVSVTKKQVNGKLTDVDGVKLNTDIVEGEYVFVENCPSDFYTWLTTPPDNRNKIRPLQGGISVTNYTNLGSYVGTLGFL